MAEVETTKDAVTTVTTTKTEPTSAAAPVAAVTPTPPNTPDVPVIKGSSITAEGVPNGLPPAAPEVQLQPPTEVIKLREWFHEHVKNSIHSKDTPHYNALHEQIENICAKLHSKYPLAKDDLNPVTKDA